MCTDDYIHSEPKLDLSSATKFFKDSLLLVREDARLSIAHSGIITEIEDVEGEALGWALYENIPGVSFKKYYATEGTKIRKQVCEKHFNIIIAEDDCDVTVETEYTTIRLPTDKRFFYICGKDVFSAEFNKNSWFYILRIPV